jgi:predicted outer membrane repeat protein
VNPSRSRPTTPFAATRFRPRVEELEARVTPAQIPVTNLLDSGVGSLRDAVATANATPGGDEIVFTGLVGTIALTSGEIAVSDDLTISGTSRNRLAISGSSVSRIFNITAGNVAISSLSVTNGSALSDGGAILIAAPATLILTDVALVANLSADDGGAISMQGRVTLSNCLLQNNTAQGDGGAIYVNSQASAVLTTFNTTIANNTAGGLGGGIELDASFLVNLVQTTISGNTAGTGGGGMDVDDDNNQVTISNSTVAGNQAVTAGGGLQVAVSPENFTNIVSTIVADNTTSSGVSPDLDGLVEQFDASLIGDISGATFGTFVGSVVGDPLLGPLARNGGPNPTHRLLFGSPAINRGLALPDGFGTDEQRGVGFVRNYADLGIDMGATEFGAGLGVERVAVGADAGIPSVVRVFNGTGGVLASIQPYVTGFTGGVRVATGDFTGDGIQDIVTAAGPGGGPNVKVFDGVTFQEVASFFAFESTFDGGVSLGVADINADGVPDVVCAAGPGGGPRIIVVDGNRLNEQDSSGVVNQDALLASFFAYVPLFNGGVTISSGDFNGDGRADLAFAAGPGGGPHVRVVDGTLLNSVDAQGVIRLDAALIGDTTDFSSFFAFGDGSFTGGVVLTTGDVNGDGLPDLMVGIASRASSSVFVRDAATKELRAGFTAFEPTFTNGVRLASVDTDGNGSAESIMVGRAPGSTSQALIVDGTVPTGPPLFNDLLFPGFTGGVFVG